MYNTWNKSLLSENYTQYKVTWKDKGMHAELKDKGDNKKFPFIMMVRLMMTNKNGLILDTSDCRKF